MNIPLHHRPSAWRHLWLIALIGLPMLGWYGILDDFSSKDINSSISNAGLIYGTARGINALVSLLQGTELNLFVMTFSIGEILDPVNDLIERFSEVVLLALASLALQKILLAVVSHTMFNILLSVVAVVTGLSLFIGNHRVVSGLLRTFLVIAFLRFSLGFVVLANGWVDTTFLDADDRQRHAAMMAFKGELREIEKASKGIAELEEKLETNEKEVERLRAESSKSEQALDTIDTQIEAASIELRRLSIEAGGLCQYIDIFGTCPDNVIRYKQGLERLESQREGIVKRLAAMEEAIELLEERADCIKRKSRGEPCSLLDRLPSAPNPAVIRHKLDELNDSVSEFAENCINLRVSLLLKTVAIPLAFIYIILKILRMNWARI